MRGGGKQLQSTNSTGIVGLVNTGNTCFLNSVCQALSSLSEFSSYLSTQSKNDTFFTRRLNNSVTNTLFKTMMALTQKNIGRAIIPPLRENPGLSKKFLTSEQQDAHEFMQYLLATINDESDSYSHIPTIVNLLTQPEYRHSFVLNAFGIRPDLTLNSPLFSSETPPFAGLLQGTLRCTRCNYTTKPTYQKFSDLSLPIPKGFFTLEDCLKEFTKSELVPDTRCGRCHEFGAYKRLTVALPPKLLFIQLRRLISTYYGTEKLNTHIAFPKQLDMLPYCTDFATEQENDSRSVNIFSSIKGGLSNYSFSNTIRLPKKEDDNEFVAKQPILYKLTSVIVHSGNHRGGHYTAMVRSPFNETKMAEPPIRLNGGSLEAMEIPKEKWYHISDEASRTVEVSDVLGSQAYMLFYEQAPSQ